MKQLFSDTRQIVLAIGVTLAAALGVVAGVDLIPETVAGGSRGAAVSERAPDVGARPAAPGDETAPPRGSRVGEPAGERETRSPEVRQEALPRGFAGVAERVSPAVVTIRVEKTVEARGGGPFPDLPEPFEDFFRRRREQEPRLREGVGSGFIVDEAGYVVTNNHVVSGAENITVQLPDRRQIDDVEVVGTDPQTDVALLKVDGDGLSAVPLGHSDSTRVGDWVLAVGSPGFGPSEVLPFTVTAGIVSAKGRSINILSQWFQQRDLPNLSIENFIQTDAVINRGNSGGPLVNLDGEVVGMNTAIMSETGTYMGYGFAVPAELIRQVVDDLKEYGEVRRAMLGVTISAVTAADARYYGLDAVRGVKVDGFSDIVEGENPARGAGIRPGDVIVELNGKRVDGVADLQATIRSFDPGETVRVTVVHRSDRERETVRVRLGEAKSRDALARGAEEGAEAAAAADPFGVEVSELEPQLRRRLELPDDVDGVVVTDVASRRSPLAQASGLPPQALAGAVIQDINGQPVVGVDAYREIVAALEPGEVASVRMYLSRFQQHRFVSVEIPEEE